MGTITAIKGNTLQIETDYAGRQSQGKRPNQEDAYGVVPPEDMGDEEALLAIVADGMGGHAAGEVASSLAVQAFVDGFFGSDAVDDASRLWAGLETANAEIGKAIRERPELNGMGTTLLAVVIRAGSVRWISVGDSPLYLLRDGELRCLNRLHVDDPSTDSVAQSGALASAVIGERLYEVDDQAPVTLNPADLLVAASDGLNTLPESELVQHLTASSAESAAFCAEALIQAVAACDHPKQDNTTVFILRQP
jgi:serine/threonine protein phosphatase PrpC